MRAMFLRAAFQLTYLSCILCFAIPPPSSNFVNKVHGLLLSDRALLSLKKAGVHSPSMYKMAAVDVTDATFKREVLESNGDACLFFLFFFYFTLRTSNSNKATKVVVDSWT